MMHFIARLSVALVGAIVFASLGAGAFAQPVVKPGVFKGKSASCIARFKQSHADFCRAFDDQRLAAASGNDPKMSNKEVNDILWVLNDVASSCKFEHLDLKECAALPAAATAFGGIGVAIVKSAEVGDVLIVEVLKGGPAGKAGLAVGDLIVKVDEVPTSSLGADKVRLALRGAVGSTVRLEVTSESSPARRTLTISRELIQLR